MQSSDSRRHFLRAAIFICGGLALLATGTANRIFYFFFGPRLNEAEEEELMQAKLKSLEATTAQRKLELQRDTTDFIEVAKLTDLNDSTGKYFIDYQMQPALAFAGKDGLPILLSAKCTHLGCTVGNQVDGTGKILCPCHVSYFDVVTGEPNKDAPAKLPLPHLGWVIMDSKNNHLAARTKDGTTTGSVPQNLRADARVFIAKDQTAT